MNDKIYIATISKIGSTLIRQTQDNVDVNNVAQILLAQSLLKQECVVNAGTENERFDLPRFVYMIRSTLQFLFFDEKSRTIAQQKFYSQYKHLSDALQITQKTQGDVAIALARNCQRDAIKLMIGALVVQWFVVALEYSK